MNLLTDPQMQLQVLLQVGLAMLLGAIIGLDREFADKPAGLRTHMLVSGAAALLVSLSSMMIRDYLVSVGSDYIRSDPIRTVQSVITGVTFLGAGTIIRSSERDVEGLTTAVSILFATAVGMCVALSQYWLAGGASVLAVIILRVVGVVEKRFQVRRRSRR